MASLRKRTRGGSLMFEIDFYQNGQRKTIPLGVKYTQKTANELKGIVETLLRYTENGTTVVDRRTETWIETASPEIRVKLSKAGLIELPPSRTLKEMWDMCRKTRKVKESTLAVYDHRMIFFVNPAVASQTDDLTKPQSNRNRYEEQGT